eukprot:2005583-Prymnesium_polylepis.1
MSGEHARFVPGRPPGAIVGILGEACRAGRLEMRLGSGADLMFERAGGRGRRREHFCTSVRARKTDFTADHLHKKSQKHHRPLDVVQP